MAPTLEIIKDLDSLPAWVEVISNSGGEAEVPSGVRSEMCAVSTTNSQDGQKRAYIVAGAHAGGSIHLHGLRSELRSLGYSLEGYGVGGVLKASSSVIEALYDGSSGKNKTRAEAHHDSLIRDALENNASDIHIVVNKDTAEIRQRIDSVVHKVTQMSADDARHMAAVLYELSGTSKNENAFRYNCDLETQIIRNIDGKKINLRFQLKPISVAEESFVVFLRLGSGGALKPVARYQDLGYTDVAAEALEQMTEIPKGLVIYVGETNSGKTTCLLHMLQHRQRTSLPHLQNIVSVEDPPEYDIDGVIQTPVTSSESKEGLSPFADAVKRAVRCDLDALLVGEIRDEDTAQSVMRVAQTDHAVFATLHASSPFEAILRLRELGMKMDVVGSPSFLGGIVYQRLIPKLCPHCSEPLSAASHLKPQLIERVQSVVSRVEFERIRVLGSHASECEHCNGSGYAGRALCAEAVVPSLKIKRLISKNLVDEAMDEFYQEIYAQEDGVSVDPEFSAPSDETTLGQAISRMTKGEISPFEIEKRIGRIDPTAVKWKQRASLAVKEYA